MIINSGSDHHVSSDSDHHISSASDHHINSASDRHVHSGSDHHVSSCSDQHVHSGTLSSHWCVQIVSVITGQQPVFDDPLKLNLLEENNLPAKEKYLFLFWMISQQNIPRKHRL